jgi:hypothetical protein
MAPGANADVLQTERFSELQGQARLSEAPSDITLEAFSIDGGFLSARWTDAKRNVLNTRGSCLAVYGRRLHVDLEANNCPEHMLYSEGQGSRIGEEVASQFRLSGLVAGEECVVFRGVGDSRIESLSAGVCGAKRLQPVTAESCSRWMPGACGFDGLLVQRSGGYEGTLEIGYAHMFAAFSGWGLRTVGNPRLHASHVVAESNRGGVFIDGPTWGAIDLLDIHSNGKTASPAEAAWPGLEVHSTNGFSVSRGLIARTAGSGEGFVGAVLAGEAGQFALTVFNTRNSARSQDYEGDAVHLAGKGNVLTLTSQRVHGALLVLGGSGNLATVTGTGEVRLEPGGQNTLVRAP